MQKVTKETIIISRAEILDYLKEKGILKKDQVVAEVSGETKAGSDYCAGELVRILVRIAAEIESL